MIFAAGLSPAWQQILQFEQLERGEVNRATETHWCASGKVINVGIAAKALGSRVSLLSTIGGLTGEAIAKEVEGYDILTDWVHVDQPTRVCTTILESDGTTTELVENTGIINSEELDEFVEKFRIHSQVADVSVLTGSIPPNAGNDYYAKLIRHLPGRFILDIRGEGLVQTLPYCPFLVKPNREELEQTVGSKLESTEEILDAMRTLNGWGAEWVVVSNGPENLLLTSREEAWCFTPPEVQVVNPIGCGDCLAAGIAVAISEEMTVPEAVKFGTSVATVNALQILPAKVQRDQSAEIAGRVVSEQLF